MPMGSSPLEVGARKVSPMCNLRETQRGASPAGLVGWGSFGTGEGRGGVEDCGSGRALRGGGVASGGPGCGGGLGPGGAGGAGAAPGGGRGRGAAPPRGSVRGGARAR